MQRGAVMLAAVLAALVLASAVHGASFTYDFSKGLGGWTHSSAEKYNGRFEAVAPPGASDAALKVPEKARHYGIATALPETTDPSQGLVLQYDLKLADGLTCGGAYLKFLTADADIKFEELKDDSAYTVMFGPDKCGSTNKVHLILRHKSPKTGEIEEKHLKLPPSVLLDDKTHVYTAVLHPNNTYDVLIDGESKKSGSLFEDFEPPFNPPEEIDDPEETKPEDWVDTAKIADPEAKKPDDWDEDAPREIPDEEAQKPEGWLDDEPDEIDDPDAKQPEDWDEEEDGVWEPPRISNPACKDAPGCGEWKRPTKSNPDYKGKWSAPMIDNPAYKGIWRPQKIANPAYYKDDTPLANLGKIDAAAIEIWTMDNNYYFNDIVVANDPAVAEEFRLKTWTAKHEAEEAEAKKKEAEEEAKRKSEETKESSADALSEKLNGWFSTLVDKVPFLEPVQPYASKAIDWISPRPYVLYGALLIPSCFILVAISALFSTKGQEVFPNKVPASVAKKEDTVTADDAAVTPGEPAATLRMATAEVEDEAEDEADAAEPTTRKRTGRIRRET